MSWELFHSGEFFSTLCALFFSVGVILFRKCGEQLSPVPLNLFKDTMALLLLLLTLPLIGVPLVPPERTLGDWSTLLLSGVVGIGVADSLFFASLNRLGAGRFAIVACLFSPLVILGSYLYLGSEVDLLLIISMTLMVSAILIGTLHPELEDQTSGESPRQLKLGVFLGVLAMIGMAFGVVIAKPVLNICNPWWATTIRLIGGVMLLSVQGLSKRYQAEVLFSFIPGRLWLVTIPTMLIGTYAAMVFWIMGMTYTETTTASVLNQLSTIFVLILAKLILREPLTKRKIIAIALGFAGGVLVVL